MNTNTNAYCNKHAFAFGYYVGSHVCVCTYSIQLPTSPIDDLPIDPMIQWKLQGWSKACPMMQWKLEGESEAYPVMQRKGVPPSKQDTHY